MSSWLMRQRQNYIVIDYMNDVLLYDGRSETAAATVLDPGTVFGSGSTKEAAKTLAKCRAQKAKKLVEEHGIFQIK